MLEKHKMTRRALAKVIKVDPSAITHLLNGRRRLTLPEMHAIAKKWDISPNEVATNAGVPVDEAASPNAQWNRDESVTVSGHVDATLKVHWGTAPGPQIVRAHHREPTASVVRMVTANSSLAGFDGFLVYFLPRKTASAEMQDRLCIVQVKAGDPMLAVIRRGYAGVGLVNIYDPFHNGLLASDVALESASPVVSMEMGW